MNLGGQDIDRSSGSRVLDSTLPAEELQEDVVETSSEAVHAQEVQSSFDLDRNFQPVFISFTGQLGIEIVLEVVDPKFDVSPVAVARRYSERGWLGRLRTDLREGRVDVLCIPEYEELINRWYANIMGRRVNRDSVLRLEPFNFTGLGLYEPARNYWHIREDNVLEDLFRGLGVEVEIRNIEQGFLIKVISGDMRISYKWPDLLEYVVETNSDVFTVRKSEQTLGNGWDQTISAVINENGGSLNITRSGLFAQYLARFYIGREAGDPHIYKWRLNQDGTSVYRLFSTDSMFPFLEKEVVIIPSFGLTAGLNIVDIVNLELVSRYPGQGIFFRPQMMDTTRMVIHSPIELPDGYRQFIMSQEGYRVSPATRDRGFSRLRRNARRFDSSANRNSSFSVNDVDIIVRLLLERIITEHPRLGPDLQNRQRRELLERALRERVISTRRIIWEDEGTYFDRMFQQAEEIVTRMDQAERTEGLEVDRRIRQRREESVRRRDSVENHRRRL